MKRPELLRPLGALSASIALGLAVPFIVISIPPVPPAVDLVWDWANALGYIALALFVMLFYFVGRPGGLPLSGGFYANLHRDLGYAVLILVAAHIGLLVYSEPLLVEHLMLTAPHYMLAGLLAFLLTLYLVVPAIPALRRRLWNDYHLFRRLHAVVAVLALFFLVWHVVASEYYLNTRWKLLFLAALSGLLMLHYLHRRLRRTSGPALVRIRNSSRFSHWVSFGVVTGLALLSLGLAVLMDRPE